MKVKKKIFFFCVIIIILIFGFSYSAVPLYKIFCQIIGIGGILNLEKLQEYVVTNFQLENNKIYTIIFMSTTINNLDKNLIEFYPEQSKLNLFAGQTCLAFYKIHNNLNNKLSGIFVYVVIPERVTIYLNKIECFCFEQHIFNPSDNLDLPILFFLDNLILYDKQLRNVTEIILQYTFLTLE